MSLKRLRSGKARGALWQENAARALEGGQPGVAESAEARQLAAAILAEADEETAAIALHRFVEGLTQGEIAGLVGRSRITVNQKLQRFREGARRFLEVG